MRKDEKNCSIQFNKWSCFRSLKGKLFPFQLKDGAYKTSYDVNSRPQPSGIVENSSMQCKSFQILVCRSKYISPPEAEQKCDPFHSCSPHVCHAYK